MNLQFMFKIFKICRFTIKDKRAVLVVFYCVLLFGIIMPSTTHASIINWGCLGGVLGCVTGHFIPSTSEVVASTVQSTLNALIIAIGSIIILLTGSFATMAHELLRGVMSLPATVGGYVIGASYTRINGPEANQIIAVGWPIVRDFANIFVVLGLIATALATILRWPDGWQAKQILPKLIISALLINFSLVICGVFIDISNTVMYTFINAGNNADIFGSQFTNSINAVADIARNGFAINAPNPVNTFSLVATIAIYNIVATMIFILYFFLFIFRFIALWIFVILSPLAFVFAVFPAGQKFWNMWKDNFIQWCIIGIPGAFSIYLANAMTSAIVAATPNPNQINPMQYFVPTILLIGGFLASLQTSAMGASYATGLGKKMSLATGKWSGKLAGAGTVIGAKYTAGGLAGAVGGVKGAWQAWRTGGSISAGATAGAQQGVQTAVQAKDVIKRIGGRAIEAGRYAGTLGDRAMEQSGVFGADEVGTADMAERERRKKATADAKALSENRTREQIEASISSTPMSDSAKAQRAADIQVGLKKGWLNTLTNGTVLNTGERVALAEQSAAQGGSWDELAGAMNGEDAAFIVQGNRGNGKAREEALKRLKAINQLNRLSSTQLSNAMIEMRNRGSDITDIVNASSGEQLRDAFRSGLFNPADQTKIYKAILDKKQQDLLTYGERIDGLVLGAVNGLNLPSAVDKLNSADKADIINNANTPNSLLERLHAINPNLVREVVGKATGSLMDNGDLDLINNSHALEASGFMPAGVTGDNKQISFTMAQESGISPEKLDRADSNLAQYNPARIQRLEAANPNTTGMAPAAYENMIRDMAIEQATDENIGRMPDDQLRNINHTRLTYERIRKFTPEKIAVFNSASADHKRELRAFISMGGAAPTNPILLNELTDAYNNSQRESRPGGNQARANSEYQKYEKLLNIYNAIGRIP